MKKIVLLMFLLLPLSASASQANWLGTWEGETKSIGSESNLDYTILTLSIKKISDGSIEGDLCIVSRGGRWIDCDNNFNGVNLNDKKYEIKFSSSFARSSLNISGRAILTLNDKKVYWELLSRPNVIDDKYYAPIKLLLIKKKVETIGVIVEDGVFLYPEPSESKAYSIRLSDGDVVYINSSNESKTWYKVEYDNHIGWIKGDGIIVK